MNQQLKHQYLLIAGIFFCLALGLIGALLNFSGITSDANQPVMSPVLNGKTVILDPGHGSEDSGCTYQGMIAEEDLTLKTAEEIAQQLRAEGAKVVLTRAGDTLDGKHLLFSKILPGKQTKTDLDTRIALAPTNKTGGKEVIFISLHVNSSFKTSTSGPIAYYSQTNPLSRDLAYILQREMVYIPEAIKRTSQPRDYYLLNRLTVPAAVVELGYLSNKQDREKLQKPSYRNQLAQGICTGIIKYFDETQTTTMPQLQAVTKTDNAKRQSVLAQQPCLYFPPKNQAGVFLAQEPMRPISTINTPEGLALSALEQLSEGPEEKNTLLGCLPTGLTIRGCKISGSLATVDLSFNNPNNKVRAAMGSDEEWAIVCSIAYTLLDLSGIQKVQLLLDGQLSPTLAGHINISTPLTRDKLPLTDIPEGVMDGVQAKAAIVIDDFGQTNPGGATEMFSIERPLTFAIMPNGEYAQSQANTATQKGFEIIVHLPMEPVQGRASWLGPGGITSGMTTAEIRRQTHLDFDLVPYANGFNNPRFSR